MRNISKCLGSKGPHEWWAKRDQVWEFLIGAISVWKVIKRKLYLIEGFIPVSYFMS